MSQSQDLAAHRWHYRLLLVLADHSDQALFQQQIDIFRAVTPGLQERKLLVYQVLPQQYRLGETSWIKSDQLYRQYKEVDSPFTVILIGLDGGVKLQRDSLLSSTELFALIDGMPMRQAELKRNQKQD